MSEVDRPRELEDLDLHRALVEGIPAILYIDKPDEYSTNFYTSPQAVDLLGFTQEEWGSTPELWLQQIHPDDVQRVIEENRRTNQTSDRFLSEYRMIAKDGRVVWLRDEAVLVRDEDGEPLHWRGIMLDITNEKEAEEKLRWSLEVLRRTSQQRRELMERLENAQEQERRRIASDIHDDSIQVMSAVDMRLQTLALEGGANAASLLELHGIVQDAIERLRHLLFQLRPFSLDQEGLAVALRQFLEHTAARTGLSWMLDADGLLEEPAPDLRAVIYRIAQEAVMNVRKHAAASEMDVTVATAGTGVILRVRDDGKGFDPLALTRATPGHLGLATTIERAEIAGGWARVHSSPGSGTTLECWLPMEQAEESQPVP
ncbi:MAG: PAS domain-containing protein [Actinobacteria bacterium]|nr:PAS domain-containing protein [Actinomycetota bacterium]